MKKIKNKAISLGLAAALGFSAISGAYAKGAPPLGFKIAAAYLGLGAIAAGKDTERQNKFDKSFLSQQQKKMEYKLSQEPEPPKDEHFAELAEKYRKYGAAEKLYRNLGNKKKEEKCRNKQASLENTINGIDALLDSAGNLEKADKGKTKKLIESSVEEAMRIAEYERAQKLATLLDDPKLLKEIKCKHIVYFVNMGYDFERQKRYERAINSLEEAKNLIDIYTDCDCKSR
ncbi:hypothetical protein JXB27_00720 [Candidatus Woesearchaeota archaeon]|nr:hypothetical protein [Candidatus Woesearchaeota archaeon]